jgi:hypothetical protein
MSTAPVRELGFLSHHFVREDAVVAIPCSKGDGRPRSRVPHTLREHVPSPSVKCTRGRPQNTRGRLPRVQHSGKAYRGSNSRGRGLPRVLNLVHSGKPFPSAVLPLGDDLTPSVPSPIFFTLPRVQHSGKKFPFFKKKFLPRVQHSGKKFIFF